MLNGPLFLSINQKLAGNHVTYRVATGGYNPSSGFDTAEFVYSAVVFLTSKQRTAVSSKIEIFRFTQYIITISNVGIFVTGKVFGFSFPSII
jgi:hypothetical protein